MKIVLSICISILCFFYILYSPLYAKEKYAFIKSKDLKQINMVIKGFQKSYNNAEIRTLDLKGNKDYKLIENFIAFNKPDLIICLGSLAAVTTVSIQKKIPIIFCLVINYQKYDILKQQNVIGVSMEIPPASLFTQFKFIMPSINSVGVAFNPKVSSEIINEAFAALKKLNINLISMKVLEPDNIDIALKRNIDKYSALWMMADTKLYNRHTKALSKLISFSKKYKKPLMAFSEAFLKSGALFTISIDYSSIGSQIALMSKRLIYDNISPQQISIEPPIGTYTVINRPVAELILGDKLDEAIYDLVDKVYPNDEADCD